MAGVTSIEAKESLDELTQQLYQFKTSCAKAVGKYRNTLQTWLSMYHDGGVEDMLEIKKSPGGVRGIPQWAEDALAKRLRNQ